MRHRIFASTDRRNVLSMLCVFVVFNYLYAFIVWYAWTWRAETSLLT